MQRRNHVKLQGDFAHQQDKLVKRIEFLSHLLKGLGWAANLFFKYWPVYFLPAQIEKLIVKAIDQRRARVIPRNELIPPRQQAVYVADFRQALDQKFFYVLKHGRIWFKPIAAPLKSEWRLFGADGRPPSGLKLKAISSDGVNIIAIDETDIVNYVHSHGIQVTVNDCDWQIKKMHLDWTNKWFAMPLVNAIASLFRRPQLKLPENCQAFAISQKGPETGYYTDITGKKHPEFLVGVTTLYALTKNGRIFFADPWLGNEFRNEITAPEDGQFVADNMAAAASTLFLIRRDEKGHAIFYTRFADFDSIGSNPILPATYDLENKKALVRCLPAEDWQQQPEIELIGRAKLTGNIAILQTGRGQHNRQLRVEGLNAYGQPGYYFKNIDDPAWQFEITPKHALGWVKLIKTPPPPPPVNFRAKSCVTEAKIPVKSIAVKKFLRHGLNERGLHTTVVFRLTNGRELTFPLYAYRGLAHLFGWRNHEPYWQLVMPCEYKNEQDIAVQKILKTLFKNKMAIGVTLKELKNGNLIIANQANGFKFEFQVRKASGFVAEAKSVEGLTFCSNK